MALRFGDTASLQSGLPMGGFGCGTLQVFPDGTRGLFTGLNNWEQPLQQLHRFRHGSAADFRQANPFGLFVEWEGRKTAKLLQRAQVAECPLIHAISMTADFPVAELAFQDPDIPIDVHGTFFSPFIPRDYKRSSLPVVIALFRLRNPLPVPVTVGVLGCCLNVVGSWNVGRVNRIAARHGLVSVECLRRHSHPWDEQAGEVALTVEIPDDAQVTYLANWRYAKEPFRGHAEDRRLEAWPSFAHDGRLPNHAAGQEAMGELDEPMGAVAVRMRLEPGHTRDAVFYYSWVAPNHRYGHRYSRWFAHARDVARYASVARTTLLRRTTQWHQTIRDAGLPEWLADGLINSLAVYPATSWWTRDGRFVLYENPIKWPLMDSLDVRYYGTLPLACWFPKFEQSTLLQFARAQRADGRIPHDLGKAQLECPSDGTTAGAPWKDLATKFALMAYRDVLWGGDRRFLARIYPSVKRAMLWEFTTDRNADGLPDNEGADTTFDLWPFYGAGAYTGSIFLAALLASQRMAQLVKDAAFARLCRRWFREGVRSFDEKLWTGTYYAAARQDDGSVYEACTAGQLNGQWYAHLLGLGYLAPAAQVRKAVETMLALNGQRSRYGAVNAVFPDGRVDNSSYHAKNIWAGETYALSALAIEEGFVEEALALSERMWLTFASHAKNIWAQPDVVEAEDGRLGDGEFYMRNVAIWAIPFALARRDGRVRTMMQRLAPHLPEISLREISQSQSRQIAVVMGTQ